MKNLKIRLIFFSDTHLGFDYPLKPRVERRRRGQEFFDNYAMVLSYALEHNADFVIHGGDFFFRSKVPQKIIDLAYLPLGDFTKSGIPIFIVPGNHERSKLPSSLFLGFPTIHVFDKPRSFMIARRNVSISISGFPFQRKNIRSRFPTVLAESEFRNQKTAIQLLCMHQAVEGAKVGTQNYTFSTGDDVIRKQDLPSDCTAILCGHIHRKQVLNRKSNFHGYDIPVIYPGSTQRTSFAERLEEKGFFEIEFGQTIDDTWQVQRMNFIPLPSRPMIDIFIDDKIEANNLESFLLSKLSAIDQNAIVRLKWNGALDEQVQATLTAQFLRDHFPGTFNFQFNHNYYRNRSK